APTPRRPGAHNRHSMSVPPTDDVPPTTAEPSAGPASETAWREERLRFRPLHMVRTWLFSAIGLLVAAWIVPGAHINGFWAALLVAAVIAALNAIIPAIRLPLTLVFGFLAILVVDALMLLAADAITDERMSVDGFWWALLVALIASAVTLVIEVIAGVDDDSEFSYRVVQRIARKTGAPVRTDAPGVVFLEIDGLALPVLRRAMRDGN